MSDGLPIRQVLTELKSALAFSSAALLCAPPGSGKTTIVPLELLDQPWLAGHSILMLEPRRLAARASAARMAWLLGEPLGRTVGYRVRFDSRVSASTRIEVMTEGLFTRRIQRDPELSGVGLVIFDEFHERSLQADLALSLVLDVVTGLRTDLRLLVMSATLDAEPLSALLGGAPVIRGEGFSYPVDIRYLSRDPGTDIVTVTLSGVLRALAEQPGDLLVFLPGSGEIRSLNERLRSSIDPGILLCQLYGDLSKEEQERAIRADPDGRRRIVLATSIAETSLTIEGISAVVDCGWSRLPRFNPNNGLTRLETVRLARSSADQRSGRAGRLGPGVCYRLWTRARQAGLQQHRNPEILDADMAPLLLELAQWGVDDPAKLKWLERPAGGAVAQARELLIELEAVDERGRITGHGRRMALQPLHPRLAHMLLKAIPLKLVGLAADLAALLSERDILRREAGVGSVDIEERLELLRLWRNCERDQVRAAGGILSACARVAEISRQLCREVGGTHSDVSEPDSPGLLLSFAYPERIARRRSGEQGRYLLASGQGVRLPEGETAAIHEFLVVAALDAGKAEGKAHLVAAVDPSRLRDAHESRILHSSEIKWDSASCSVVALEEERLGALTLHSRPIPSPDAELTRQAMLTGIAEMGLASLQWSSGAMAFRARVLSLRQWQPDASWPDFSDEWLLKHLETWLAPWLDGVTRPRHLKRLDLEAVLKSRLEWSRQQQMNRLAPSHIEVPSGSRKSLHYRPGEAPVLKVRLQEMFGLEETPSVCDGAVPVMLHLLSPAQRPVQITQDLHGFWNHTYAEIRKELKGRYPKHYWPENPRKARATSRVRPDRG